MRLLSLSFSRFSSRLYFILKCSLQVRPAAMMLSSGTIPLLLGLTFLCRICGAASHGELAITPPRGWNSYDSYSWIINEEDFLANAEIVSKRLLQYGYEYVVVDFLWYRRIASGSYTDAYGFDSIDEWGRAVPDPERWPSSRGGKGFSEVAQKVHAMGLKFGIHAMRGISLQAVDQNSPILDVTTGKAYTEGDRMWGAKDVGLRERLCAWMTHGFMSVNTETKAGRAFLLSLYKQYADWGVDFVKLDCVFGEDLDESEIRTVSEILAELERPIVFSLSPGKFASPSMAKNIKGLVNMYRITADDWDLWNDVEEHFDVARDFAASELIGADGLHGKSWPDLDMLPLGWLSDPGANHGPSRRCRLTSDEQRTQMTLWSITRSPLMFGGDLKQIDESTIDLITNPTMLEINAFSENNMEFSLSNVRDEEKEASVQTWTLRSCDDSQVNSWHKMVNPGDNENEFICWKKTKSNERPFCFRSIRLLLASGEGVKNGENYDDGFHLLLSTEADRCVGGSSSSKMKKSTAKNNFIFPCNKWSAHQMWTFNSNGTLMSRYSGLCASVESKKEISEDYRTRSWVARGRGGEIYFAIFNLNPASATASAKIEDLANAVHLGTPIRRSCNATEAWSGMIHRSIGDSISVKVNGHGCALFVISCA